MESFPPEVVKKLRAYVCRLIDPRHGEASYIGKGRGNWIFAHPRAEIADDDPRDKLKRIHKIRRAGFKVAHVIQRHGFDDAAAFEVEAVLIDAYPGLTSIVGRSGGGDFGSMHASEVVERYQAKVARFEHRAVLINAPRSSAERSLCDAARYAWRIHIMRASRAEVILATDRGIIVGAFVAETWLPATAENFPGYDPVPGRRGFIGREAPEALKRKRLRKRIPDSYRKRGAASPIKYAYR